MRQDFRETTPRILAEQFSRKLTDREWGQLHLALGKTDMAALSHLSAQDIRKLYTDKNYLNQQIGNLEASLNSEAPKVARTYLRKARELARFMVTGEIDPSNMNLLRNADAIALLMGESGTPVATAEVISMIDQLTSLYAIQQLDQGTIGVVSSLAQGEANPCRRVSHRRVTPDKSRGREGIWAAEVWRNFGEF